VRRPAVVVVTVACFVVAIVGLGACGGRSAPHSTATASVVARVNGEAVQRAEVDRLLAFSKLGSKTLTYDEAFAAVVRGHLLGQEAVKLGVHVTDAQVEQRLKQAASGLGGVAVLQQALAGVGLALNDYREQLRGSILAELVAARKFPQAAATRAYARAYYRNHTAQFVVPAAVKLQQIVTKTQGLAVVALRRLRRGEPFGSIAELLTSDPQAGENRGKLGWVLAASLPPQLAKAFAGVRPGTTVGPVQAPGGWYIDRILGVRRQRTQSFDEVRAGLMHDLSVRRQTTLLARWLTKVRATATVTQGP